MKKRNLLITSVLIGLTLTAVADPAATAGSFTVQNNTGNSLEFSGLIGGYATVNPLVGSETPATILPDPGSTIVRGHIMAYSNVPGQYLDNIVFVDQRINQQWQLQAYDLYGQLKVVVKDNNQITLSTIS